MTDLHDLVDDFESVLEDYPIKLENFEGPLDLLLHLIRKNEVDIYDIPILPITKQYLDYLDVMEELDLDVAGDFLVMAATLIHIKARMLVPRLEHETADEGDTDDPRDVLVRRLIEHEKYKAAAELLHERGDGAECTVGAARRADHRYRRRAVRARARGRPLRVVAGVRGGHQAGA